MTSLAALPALRRTITDVMEDELYHVPTHISNAQQHQHNSTQSAQQTSQIMSNLLWNNSNQSFKQSPTLAHQKLFRNPSALNSEEMLTIPDYTHLPPQNLHMQQQQHHLHQSQNNQHQHQVPQTIRPELLARTYSQDMYFDIPEDDSCNVFNSYADPDLTTTNQSLDFNFQSVDPACQPQKLLKFNEDLTLEYFNNEDESQFLIFPGSMTPSLIPEDIEDEEISDDDDDDFEMTYLDETMVSEVAQKQTQQAEEPAPQLIAPSNPHFNPQQFLNKRPSLSRDSTELESDVDRMSLASDDDSSDSVMEEEEPSFKNKKRSVFKPQFHKVEEVSPELLPQTFESSGSTPTENTIGSVEMLNNASSITENGMHQCNLALNGSACMKQFSRPYDLIRHQETIHASRKKVFRCIVCNHLEGGLSRKTFSRGDALSRHVRVKHGLSGDEVSEAMKYAKDHVEYV